jgi:hypothetical protein
VIRTWSRNQGIQTLPQFESVDLARKSVWAVQKKQITASAQASATGLQYLTFLQSDVRRSNT